MNLSAKAICAAGVILTFALPSFAAEIKWHQLGFHRHPADTRVLYQGSAKPYADQLVSVLQESVLQAEEAHFGRFLKPFKIRVCDSERAFRALTGFNVRAVLAFDGLYLSPLAFSQQSVLRGIVIHELSHVFLRQHLGRLAYARLPLWFSEGLATYVAGGGGAETISEDQAREAMLKGEAISPKIRGSLGASMHGDFFSISAHLYYRQSSLFIQYLARDEQAFRDLLQFIQSGGSLAEGLAAAYGQALPELWLNFVDALRRSG